MTDIDDMYKDGNIKIKAPKPLNGKGSDSEIEKLLKEHNLLNKQYNKLLIETNTLRKRFSYQENNIKKMANDIAYLGNENRKLMVKLEMLMNAIEMSNRGNDK
jgi:hypothetical protein